MSTLLSYSTLLSHILRAGMKRPNSDVYVESSSLVSSIIDGFGVTKSEIQYERNTKKKKVNFIARAFFRCAVCKFMVHFVNKTSLIRKRTYGFQVTGKGENIGL